jgi:nucleoid DNA-binding protein
MNKSDMIAEVAGISGVSKEDSEKAVSALLSAVERPVIPQFKMQ